MLIGRTKPKPIGEDGEEVEDEDEERAPVTDPIVKHQFGHSASIFLFLLVK